MVVIRRGSGADAAVFLSLLDELAAFEKLAGPDEAARARLAADVGRRFELFLAEDEGRAVAYAVTFETYSTFRAAPILYLEDLYVTPSARRLGVASAMMRHLAADALARGCVRMGWVVLDWNVDAQRFYERLGAARTPWVGYEVEGPALEALARPS